MIAVFQRIVKRMRGRSVHPRQNPLDCPKSPNSRVIFWTVNGETRLLEVAA